MPAFRRFWKPKHESSEIVIGQDDLTHHDVPMLTATAGGKQLPGPG
jgi:hypothetical protein